jgi:S-adenosylmethionine:tRNA ribosyltransferase-isomerase
LSGGLKTADFAFDLPEGLIARHPAPRRDGARMMVLDRASGSVRHGLFGEFESHLRPGDLAVLNDTRVIPARLYSDDGKAELLLLERLGEARWKCLARPGRKTREGAELRFGGIGARVEAILAEGERVVAFERPPDLERIGHIPLPPYMKREDAAEDRERYQTVYARHDGSVAAPTAGLHFTGEILARIPHAFVTLHVGLGTFRPVTVERPEDHVMHSERYALSAETAEAINAAARVVAVGTTTVRVLESLADEAGRVAPGAGETSIFIRPPYAFRRVGALLTNFHLPGSTLMMLVSAFAGREFVLEAYREAVREEYRLYSYGDCMLIV